MRLLLLLGLIGIFLLACNQENVTPTGKLFEQIKPEVSGIDFVNQVRNTEDFNIFSYRNFYNGGGVSLGDINNDGLPDVYLTNNMGENKLFLNLGDFNFKDITNEAGVAGTKAWSTGVVMVDINHDGWLDIYVCNAGFVEGDDQENELFINPGQATTDGVEKIMAFEEKAAAYHLNENGYTTHAAFFDYDLDGDLDCYMLNNSFMPVNTLNYSNKRELYSEDWPVRDFLKGGGDKLLRNDDGQFTNVTKEAGIYGSLIGFGLGVTIGDINDDHFPDLYVSNDFFEHDYLYINQGDGTFKEDIRNWMEHISLFSMGADMADINNDGYPEIFVTDMLPNEDTRLKKTTVFEDYNIHLLKQGKGFYNQFMHNTLQLNNKNQSFSEIAYYGGVSASDWSWGALLFDADNDGYRDIYICNGIYQDVTDQDFIDFFANDVIQKMALTGEKEEMQKVIDQMPSTPLLNKAFHNQQNLTFNDVGVDWGFETPSFSNGAAYGDLDNDGDLDLIVNNVNQQAFVYRNQSNLLNGNNYLKIFLKGTGSNSFAIGSKVFVHHNSEILNFQLIPTRGFQSSIDYQMVFGLGNASFVDSVVVIWPDLTRSVIFNPTINDLLTVDFNLVEKALLNESKDKGLNPLVVEASNLFEAHKEDKFYDFFYEGLAHKMISREGPCVAHGDINGDEKKDLVIGGGKDQPTQFYLQGEGDFYPLHQDAIGPDSVFEDTAIALFDADNDGDLDLYIGSGGNHYLPGHLLLQDRLYLNDGNGQFTRSRSLFGIDGMNTGVVLPWDFDEDGDTDLFVGNRSVPNTYGINPRNFLYKNDGNGQFENVIREVAPDLEKPGMITDAMLRDLTGDGKDELIIVGEWMSPIIFSTRENQIERLNSNLSDYAGWWYTIESDDIDQDGDFDLILGNRGENFYFSATSDKPAKLWLSDFDFNGTVEKIMTRTIDNRDMPIPMKKELTEQIVSLKKQNLKHSEYSGKSIQDLFSKEVLGSAMVKEANYFKSAVAINDGNMQFRIQPLPAQAQFSCICAIYTCDLNSDGLNDLILGGNDTSFSPQFSQLDASFGHVLINRGDGNYDWIDYAESGFFLKGNIKEIVGIDLQSKSHFLVSLNSKKHKLFKVSASKNEVFQ